MLEMRSACERCEAKLPADATAWICSYECTFCPDCRDVLRGLCPNCGGELVLRPRRGAASSPGDQRTAPEEQPAVTDPGTFQREAADPLLLTDAEARHLLHDAPWQRLCIIGDSGAEGISEPVPGYRDLVWGDRVVAEFQRARPDMRHVNLGKRNLLAAQVRETQLQQALEFEPDLLIAFLGGNDILRPAFDAAALEAEFIAIISPFLERGVLVVTSGLFDITNSPHVPEKYRTVMSQRIAQYSELVKGSPPVLACSTWTFRQIRPIPRISTPLTPCTLTRAAMRSWPPK